MQTARCLMPGLLRSVFCILFLPGGSQWALEAAEVSPLPNAHAHNDYQHKRPLLDALDQGFCSVEADIRLVDGRLLVAHDLDKTSPDRDLDSLYLTPLHERVKRNGGRVHRGADQFTLLIDFKSEAGPTYAAIKPLLAKHADMLTKFGPAGVRGGAVTVILSGNRAFAEMRSEETRLAFLDGRMSDLIDAGAVNDRDSSRIPAETAGIRCPPGRPELTGNAGLNKGGDPATLMPLVSERWGAVFKWRGTGPLPDAEAARLAELVKKAHDQGRRIRFWAIPDNPVGWQTLGKAGVDLLNTDHLPELREFLVAHPPAAKKGAK